MSITRETWYRKIRTDDNKGVNQMTEEQNQNGKKLDDEEFIKNVDIDNLDDMKVLFEEMSHDDYGCRIIDSMREEIAVKKITYLLSHFDFLSQVSILEQAKMAAFGAMNQKKRDEYVEKCDHNKGQMATNIKSQSFNDRLPNEEEIDDMLDKIEKGLIESSTCGIPTAGGGVKELTMSKEDSAEFLTAIKDNGLAGKKMAELNQEQEKVRQVFGPIISKLESEAEKMKNTTQENVDYDVVD